MKKPNIGAAVSAIRNRDRALARYAAAPNMCRECREPIAISPKQKVSEVKKKTFCSHACSAKMSNRIRNRRTKKREPKYCEQCGGSFIPFTSARRFCSRKCSSTYVMSRVDKVEMLRRGFGDSEKSRRRRMKQLAKEESMAQMLRESGWEIYSPTVVCDRVGIKDGKAFFIEFKPIGKTKLRPGQQRVRDVAIDMYLVVEG